jgi:putative membrane protein
VLNSAAPQQYGLSFVADMIKVSHRDKSFIKDAAVDGMYEVELAKLAAAQATDPAVKSFAEKLVKDHEAANDEIRKLASARNIAIDDKLPFMKRHAVDSLGKDTKNFDDDFLRKAGVKEHEKDIKAFQNASTKADDPEIRAFAEKTLPTLREHLTMAQNLSSSIGHGASGMGGNSANSASTSGSGMAR